MPDLWGCFQRYGLLLSRPSRNDPPSMLAAHPVGWENKYKWFFFHSVLGLRCSFALEHHYTRLSILDSKTYPINSLCAHSCLQPGNIRHQQLSWFWGFQIWTEVSFHLSRVSSLQGSWSGTSRPQLPCESISLLNPSLLRFLTWDKNIHFGNASEVLCYCRFLRRYSGWRCFSFAKSSKGINLRHISFRFH